MAGSVHSAVWKWGEIMKRMTVYDEVWKCFKINPGIETGRSVIQELGIYEDIHAAEIEKAQNITDIRDKYFTNGAKLDPYWENLGKQKKESDGWIPVEEKMPVHSKYVLVWHKSKGMFFMYHNDYIGAWESSDGEGFSFNDNEIIAWIDSPQPYKSL